MGRPSIGMMLPPGPIPSIRVALPQLVRATSPYLNYKRRTDLTWEWSHRCLVFDLAIRPVGQGVLCFLKTRFTKGEPFLQKGITLILQANTHVLRSLVMGALKAGVRTREHGRSVWGVDNLQ